MKPDRRTTTQQTPDAELLGRIANDDLTALGELYDRYQADVRRVLDRVTGCAPEVDDVLQATFLAIPRAAPSFDGRASARAWVVGIALRLESRRRRSLSRLLRALASFATIGRDAVDVTPEDVASDRSDLLIVERELARMSLAKREVFVLTELEGLSIEDVARVLRIPSATVRTRLFHARGALRDALSRRR